MEQVLIMCASHPQADPRPNRMIHWLKDKYAVTVLGLEPVNVDGVESIGVPSFSQGFVLTVIRKCIALLGMLFVHLGFLGLAESLSLNLHARIASHIDPNALNRLQNANFDLIVSHDIVLLPLAFAVRKKAKVLLDAREFYPRHYVDRPLWRLISQPEMDYLCEIYLHKCEGMITVSDGIAEEYKKRYRVNSQVVLSLPEFKELSPTPVRIDNIRIIHHGIASPSRRLDQMIEMMDHVDKRFSLDVMLVPQKSRYWDKLVEMASARTNVRIIPPVPMNEIVTFTHAYDIGLFLSASTTFNLKYALPNKLFEFVQARLAVAIGPSIEMRKIVEKYDCGVVSRDFEPESMAEVLNQLTSERVMYYKNQSHKASHELNAQTNTEKVRQIVRELVER